jgi:UDP-2,3-diacylglucosamine pyrophosphatase LpxH
MSQDEKTTNKELKRLWQDDKITTLPIEGNKYAIISDIHLGDKGKADDFCDNEGALKHALDHYRSEGYKLILLGDIEELWQFDLDSIKGQYDKHEEEDTVYKNMRQFGDENMFRVWGNHDSEWRAYDDPTKTQQQKNKGAHEALKMKDKDGKECILLLHGHQGSTESDKAAWLSRQVVRVFKYIEPVFKWLGLYGHASATKSQIAKDYERVFYSWAKPNKVIVICGHSHRAIFASQSYMERIEARITEGLKVIVGSKPGLAERVGKLGAISKNARQWGDEWLKKRRIAPTEPGVRPLPCYFNTGCALYKDGITAIEIANDEIRLVEWNRKAKKTEPSEFDEGKLSDFIENVSKG